MSEVSGSIPVSGLCFLLIFVVFTLCLPCYSSLSSACTVKRGAPSTACKLSTLSRHVRLLGFDYLFRTLFSYSRIMHVKTCMSWWCKCSTLSRHVRGLGFDSRVRTLFSIDLCCIYLVFTMLLIFVKRMYS